MGFFDDQSRHYPETYITTSEVTTLEHELGDDAVKLGPFIAKAFLTCAKGTEVLGSLGDNILVEIHTDGTRLLCL